MDKQPKSPITILTDALEAMTERAMAAEREMDIVKEDANNWHQAYLEKSTQLSGVNVKLAKEIAEHEKTREALQHALSPDRKGEG